MHADDGQSTFFLSIQPIPALRDNYIWAITNENKNTLIVDPGEDAPVTQFLHQNQLHLSGILITHHHWDHTNGIDELSAAYKNLPVYGPAEEAVPGVTIKLQADMQMSQAEFPRFKIISIPGHTLGHIAYYGNGILFCGDTLFAAGCGKIFEGTPEQMFQSLQKIAALPDYTKIYCAHEYTLSNLKFAHLVEPENSAIQKRLSEVEALRKHNQPTLPTILSMEKQTNPFLRCQQPTVIASVNRHAGKSLKDPVEVFTYLREWKNKWM